MIYYYADIDDITVVYSNDVTVADSGDITVAYIYDITVAYVNNIIIIYVDIVLFRKILIMWPSDNITAADGYIII